MKQVYIINENHPQLLLFFAGWAADETPFKQYRPKDMDYMICYDYRTLDFDYSIFDRYRQVNVVAWSMGVWMGSLILSQVSRDKVFSLAFNGTTYPIDNLEGIPVNTFQATLDGLTPATLQKFLRRMCCLLYTSDAADELDGVDLGGRRIIKKIFFKQKTAYEI